VLARRPPLLCTFANYHTVSAAEAVHKDLDMISTNHLDAYLAAMGRRDVAATKPHMAEDVVIHSPIIPAPFRGRDAVASVLEALLGTIDAFEPKRLLRDGADFVAVFTVRLGDHVIDGMDHMHLNEEGLVDSMTVAWRPLPAIVAVQQKLAPKLGGKALQLVPLATNDLQAA
jgi:limonene-1,2-epoxide hydrolase